MFSNTVTIGLFNPKSAGNVAAILRACGCYGASAIYYSGQRYNYAKGFNADTQKIRNSIATTSVTDLISVKPANAKTVAIEFVEGAIPLPAFVHPKNAYYLFGPEDGSLPQDVVDKSDFVVYIPTLNSMNLAATANVVLYDRLAKSNYEDSSELIRQSRDNNNRLMVK